MSAAAEQIARSWHPTITGTKQKLLDAIATAIPEGATMTRVLDDNVLAAQLGCNTRTIRTARAQLQRMRVIRVDGGKGRPASYELLQLPGAGGPPKLPLRADLRVAPAQGTPADDDGVVATPVADAGDVAILGSKSILGVASSAILGSLRSYTVGSKLILSGFGGVILGSISILRTAILGSKTILPSPQVLDVDDARARDVRTHLQEHTHAPPLSAPERERHPWHAWCDGRVHVPKGLHREFRHKLHLTDDQLFAIYAEECDALNPTDQIPPIDYDFWRPRFAARFPGAGVATKPPRAAVVAPSRPWQCPHADRCADHEACIDRQAAEFRERERRKSG